MKRKLFAVFGSVMILGSGVLAGGCGDSGTGSVAVKDATADKAGDAKGGAGGAGGTGGGTTVDANAGGRGGAGGNTGIDVGAAGAGGADSSADVNNAGGIDGSTTSRGGSGGTSTGGSGGSTTGTGGIDGGRDVGSGGDANTSDRREADGVAETGGIDGGIDGGGIDVGPCTPNSHQCSGNGVETCSSTGQWGAPVACAFPTPVCTAGACANATLTVTKAGTGTGTVTSSGANGINCGNTCSRTFATTPVVLTATAAAGSTFTGWSGGGCSGTATCSASLTAGDVAVTATFASAQDTLTVSKAGSGTGTVTSAPTGIACGATCAAPFASGASVVLTAAAATGSVFAGWSGGGCSGTTATCTVTLSAATTVTATFSLPTNTLTIVRAGTGTGTVTSTSTPAATTNINCGATCAADFSATASVVLTATPATGSAFTGWSGGGCTGTSTCTLSVTEDTIVTANFAPVVGCATVATAATCTGGTAVGGTFATDLSPVQCHDQCQAAMAAASTASGCWMLNGAGACVCRSGTLTGGGTNSGGTCSRGDYALNVTKAGNGTGEVASNPTGISCGTTGTTCSVLYAAGDSVDLTATAGTGSTFTGWSGGGCTGTTTCTVSMTAARNVTATFTLATFTLTVTKAGSGTVTSDVTGINCGTDCTQSYNYGTSVTLTATAASGSAFAGWSGGGCSGNAATCTVSMTAATAVTATFAPPLGCTTVGNALDANCGGTLVDDLGTSLSAQGCHDGCETALAAAAATSGCWVLSGNTHCYCRDGILTPGGGSSPGGSCNAGQYALTVDKAGNGTGNVTSNPVAADINCGMTRCSALFAPGSNNVTLTAAPTGGSTFAGWSGGGCTGTTPTCTVSMTADVNVTATFVVPLTCDAASGTGCGGTTVATATPANAAACRTLCGTQLPASGASTGCWLFQGGTCSCRSGSVTGAGAVAGSCN